MICTAFTDAYDELMDIMPFVDVFRKKLVKESEQKIERFVYWKDTYVKQIKITSP